MDSACLSCPEPGSPVLRENDFDTLIHRPLEVFRKNTRISRQEQLRWWEKNEHMWPCVVRYDMSVILPVFKAITYTDFPVIRHQPVPARA